MKFFCESGAHILFDSEAHNVCSTCASRQRLISEQRVMPKELKFCATHWIDRNPNCLSCMFALDWNLMRKYCISCGGPAVGYRTMRADEPVEFYCDTHWQPIPQSEREFRAGEKG